MVTREDWIQRVGLAKAAMDNGFSRVGPSLSSDEPWQQILLGAAARMVRFSNAIVVLCKQDHAREALPLLYATTAIAEMMGRVGFASGEEMERVLDDIRQVERGGPWEQQPTPSHQEEALEEQRRWLFEQCSLYEMVRLQEGPSGLPWGHLFPTVRRRPLTPERVLEATVLALECCLRALGARWPGAFGG